MANYDLTNLALKATNPGNVVLLDDKNLPSIKVRIPKFTIGDVVTGGGSGTHPAFIVNGRRVPEIKISKYHKWFITPCAYRCPEEYPGRTAWTSTQPAQLARPRSPGWHIMTNAEWAAAGASGCRKNTSSQTGNNDYWKTSPRAPALLLRQPTTRCTPPKRTARR